MRRRVEAKAGDASRGPQLGDRLRGISATTLTRAGHLGLWAVLGLTFLAAAVALVRPPPKAAAAVKAPESTVGAQGFSELYVAAYLSAGKGSEESLRAVYPVAVDFKDVAPGGIYAGRTTAIEAREVQHGYWAVTVGAEVLFPQSGGLASGGVRFYQVSVARVGESYVATSLPAEVPAPAPGRGAKLAVPSMDRPSRDDPVAAAVARFGAAFLGGEDELARYTAPGSTLRPVRPAPFRAVAAPGSSPEVTPTDTMGGIRPARISGSISSALTRPSVAYRTPCGSRRSWPGGRSTWRRRCSARAALSSSTVRSSPTSVCATAGAGGASGPRDVADRSAQCRGSCPSAGRKR